MQTKKLTSKHHPTVQHTNPLELQIKRDSQIISVQNEQLNKSQKSEPMEKNRSQLAPFIKPKDKNDALERESEYAIEESVEKLPKKMSKRFYSQVLFQQQEIHDESVISSTETFDDDNDQEVSDDEGTDIDGDREALLEELDALYAEEDENSADQFNRTDRELFEKWIRPSSETSCDGSAPRTLAEMILAKLEEVKEKSSSNTEPDTFSNTLPEKVIEVYRKLGILLTRYKSGKLPKAFKILPALSNWQEVLAITAPASWTPHSVYQATRLFASSLKPQQAQLFYESILLPHIRANIAEHKKLNVYLYDALKKAIYKPSAFYKGLILPLCASGDCTLKEAVIVSSVLSKQSISVLHSAACLLKLSEMEYSGCVSIFIRTLLDKKYSLPKRVISSLVAHFSAIQNDPRPCYLLWHQSLLVFIQRKYLSEQEKESIRSLCAIKKHEHVTPEILRELISI